MANQDVPLVNPPPWTGTNHIIPASARIAGSQSPEVWKKICQYVWSKKEPTIKAPTGLTVAQIALGDALVAGRYWQPYWLEDLYRRICTYPYVRGGQSGEVITESLPWGN